MIPVPSGSRATAGSADLTAKARIRNAALALYADNGEDGTSMRAIAEAADVTVGLVVHHYRTKDGLRDALERRIVEFFADAITQAPDGRSAREVAIARDAAVARMLEENPAVVNYLRRAVLDPTGGRSHILEMLADFTAEQVAALRTAGLASTAHRDTSQVIGVLVRQLGHLFLQPMIDSTWTRLAPDAPLEEKPQLVIRVLDPEASGMTQARHEI
ncbi:TetR/AcrR family transcriptional regulator [Nocardioides sp.]|uniref:TetR/AcrR family transcriptional regulator n=1 Tax=Nocardioides sp. TaxID=35761 RepID=UPI00321A6E92